MTSFNRLALLNAGSDNAKATQSSNGTENKWGMNGLGASNLTQSADFAQTLRMQLQAKAPVSEKPASAIPTSAQNTPKENTITPTDTKSADTTPQEESTSVKDEANAAATPNTMAKTVNAKKGTMDATASAKNAAKQNQVKQAEDASQTQTENLSDAEKNTKLLMAKSNPETASTQDEKQEAQTSITSNDPTALVATLPLSPWMQSMLAMRNNADSTSHLTASVAGENASTQDTERTTGLTLASKTAGLVDSQNLTDLNATQNASTLVVDVQSQQANHTPNAWAEAMIQAGNQSAILAADVTQDQSAIENNAMTVANVMPNHAWLMASGVAETTSVLTSQMVTPFANQDKWQTAMHQQVLNMVDAGDEVASLTLSPPDLGPIQVVLKVDNQSVDTSFITDNPLVRQALEDGMQDLRERMQSQGLQLGQTFVGNGEQAQQHFKSPTSSSSANNNQSEEELIEVATPVGKSIALGAVDTFA